MVTLDGENTIHISRKPIKKFRKSIFIGDDLRVHEDISPHLSDSDESTARSYERDTYATYEPPRFPLCLPPNEEAFVRITVSSLAFHDPGVVYFISVSESFKRIYDDYAFRCDYTD